MMLSGIVEVSERRPYAAIAVVAIITVGMVYGAAQVSMTTDLEKFLPEDYTSVQVTNMVENQMGGTTREIILVEGDNLSSADSFRSIVELKSSLLSNPDFSDYIKGSQVRSYTDYIVPILDNRVKKIPRVENWESLENQKLEMMIDRILAENQLRQQTANFLSENENAALLTILVNMQLSRDELQEQTEDLHNYIQSVDENYPGLEMSVTGSLSMEMDTRSSMNRDNRVLIPVAILVVIVILYLVFRRVSDTVLPFLVLGLGSVWMLGAMGYAGIPFSMVYVALLPIILGVGIDYTIHMLNRYYEERGKGRPVEESTVRSVRTVGVAIALTAITTIIGFGSFGISDIPPVRNFGFLAGAGVFSIFALATTFLPAVVALRDRGGDGSKGKSREERGEDRIGQALSKLGLGTIQHKKPILVGAGVITALCIVSATGLSATMSFDTFLSGSADSVATMEEVEGYFGTQTMQNFVLVKGDVTSPEGLRTIGDLEEVVMSDPANEGLVSRSSSITDLVKSASGGQIPQTDAQISAILSGIQSESPKRYNLFMAGENETIVYFYVQAETDKEMEDTTDLIRSHVREFAENSGIDLDFTHDGKPAVGGSPAVISDIMSSILPSMRNSIILAIILVGIVLALVFRSAIIGFIGAMPVILALLWQFGAIWALGWSFDVMNMMVSALAIGIGVDFAIHMTHRFQEEWGENGKSPEKSISISIQSVGRAIVAAAATTIGVFVVLSLSRMPPIVRFGQLAALVIFFALLGALIVLPSALLAYAKWEEKRE